MTDRSKTLPNLIKQTNPMLWGTLGYLFLFIFRPFEYWTWLGEYRIERVYMICLLTALLFWRGKRYVHHPITSAFIVFFLVICFSNFIAYHPPAAIRQTEEYFKLMVLFFVIILTVRDENDFRVFIIGFIAIMGIYIGKSLWEFLVHGRHVYRMGIRRLVGIDQTYSDPNTFAASVVYSLPFAWALWKTDISKWLRRGLLGYGLMSLTAIVFTGSRSGMVTLVLFLTLAWAAGRARLSHKILGIVGVAIFLVVGWQIVPEEYKLRYLTMVDDSINQTATDSAHGRIEGLINGLRLFTLSPLFGWGAGNFPYAVERIGVYNRMQSHNLYGQLAADLGLLGIGAFCAVCWVLYRTSRKIQGVAEKLGKAADGGGALIPAAAGACMTTVLLLLFQGNFGHNLYRYTWLVIGAVLVLSERLIVKQLAEESRLRFNAYRLIFFTRFRKPVFVGDAAARVGDWVREICASRAAAVFRLGISGDRLGMVVFVPKRMSIDELARLIRAETTKKMFSEFKNLKDELFGKDLWEKVSAEPLPNEVVGKLIVQGLSRKRPPLSGENNVAHRVIDLPPSLPAAPPSRLR